MNTVWIINGIPGSGKTTTAKALAKRFPKAAHIEGDIIQELIVSGAISPGQEPHDEECRQINLCVQNQCLLAKSFLEAGFVPIIDYVIVSVERLAEYQAHLPGVEVRLITLQPGTEVALARDEQRPEKTVAHSWTHLEKAMQDNLYPAGLWINNKALTVDQTVDQILNSHTK